MRLTTGQQLQQAIHDDADMCLIKVLCRRLGHIVRDGHCPHCDRLHTGLGAWHDGISSVEWKRLVNEPFHGLLYRCGSKVRDIDTGKLWLEGCGLLFISITRDNRPLSVLHGTYYLGRSAREILDAQPNPTA